MAGTGIVVTNGNGVAGNPTVANSGVTSFNGQTGAVSYSAPVFSYTSSEQTVTDGGTLTLAHGLGFRPTDVRLVLRCVSSNAGYSTGDEVEIGDYSGSGAYYGAVVGANATNIIIKTGNGGIAMISGGFINNASWRYVARAK
jgi:hypothetical protein